MCCTPFGWLPQLYRVLLRIMNPGETSIGIRLWVNGYFNARGTKLCRHLVEVSHAKIDHPHLVFIPEVFTRHRERLKGCRTRFRVPAGAGRIARNQSHSQWLAIPLRKRLRIASAKEQTTDSENSLRRQALN